MAENQAIENQQITKSMLERVEQGKQLRKQTLDKLDRLMQKDAKHNIKLEELNKTQRQEEIQRQAEETEKVSSNQKSEKTHKAENTKKTLLQQAIKETQKMAKLSKEATQIKHQAYSKKADDIIQVKKTTLTKNTKPGSYIEHYAATSQAIEQEEKTRYRTARIDQDNNVKNQTTKQNGNQTQNEANFSSVKKSYKRHPESLKAETQTDTDPNKESKGKAYAEEKRAEQANKSTTSTPGTKHSGQQNKKPAKAPEINKKHQHKKPTPRKPQKVNKLRAKFRRSSLHF